jgi:glutamate/tyrosine decarboxylase-like PLP-dependent enzyme
MKHYFDAYKDEFLAPSEDNFSDLLQKTTFLHTKIIEQVHENVPRVPLQSRHAYEDLVYEVPLKGRSAKKVLADLATAFQGSTRWHQPTALINVTPNPLLDSVAAANVATLYNANALWDYMCGNVIRYEKEVVAFLSHLAGWERQKAEGLSTTGGKATLMYAIRCGLNVCDRQSVSQGLHGDYVVIAARSSHYSIEDNCNYAGIGRANVIRVAVDTTGAMIPEAFEQALRRALEQGKKIAAIIALGGDTLEHAVDPIKKLHDIRNALSKEFHLNYRPLLHLDSVNAWISLTFREYDFSTNPLGIEAAALKKIRTLTRKMSEVLWADSFSADFHKTGLTPYISSFFVIRAGEHLHSINKERLLASKPSYQYGEVHTHHISFENSRASSSILSTWTSIQRLGIEGYQRYWAQLITTGLYIQQVISTQYDAEIKVVNKTALGYPNVIQLIPPGFDYSFDDLLINPQALETYSTYCFELYEYMAYELLKNNHPYPLVGFVPHYKYEISGTKRPAFLLYLNHPCLREQDCNQLLQSLMKMKHGFEARREKYPQKKHASRLSHLPK